MLAGKTRGGLFERGRPVNDVDSIRGLSSLSDLCPLLGVQTAVTDRGVELTPIQAAL